MAPIAPQMALYNKLAYWACLNVFLTSYFHTTVTSSQATTNTLPGFNGTLPFVLETGYVNVGEANDIELFYYFVESEKDPQNDPLLLWLTGGPGCSSFSGFIYENGPLSFDTTATHGELPSLVLNPYSWTKISSIIYVDSPVGTGFSYASSSKGYNSTDTKSSKDVYDFLRKWLLDHPKFIKNPLYICGDSYGGIFVPIVALEIAKGNEAGYLPHLSLQGYMLGNPITANHGERNSRIQYAHALALISDEYYKSVQESCNGEYVNPDPNNSVCMKYVQLINECTAMVNPGYILEGCIPIKYVNLNDRKSGKRSLQGISMVTSLPLPIGEGHCWIKKYDTCVTWLNNPDVQQAIHVRDGIKTEWKRCNSSLSYERNVPNVVEYHRNLTQRNYRALVFSGDHDLLAPYIATLSWIKSLNLTTEDVWRPWFVDGQIAGYTEKYRKNGYDLTFATAKGAGHVAIEFMPKEVLAMVERWFSKSQL